MEAKNIPSDSFEPVSKELLEIPTGIVNSILSSCGCFIGIDVGSILTKIIFLSAEGYSPEAQDQPLTCYLYSNSSTMNGMEKIKKEALFQNTKNNSKIHITGSRGLLFKDEIAQKLKVEVNLVEEEKCHVKGLHFLIKEVAPEKYLQPHCETDNSKLFKLSFYDKFTDEERLIPESRANFPIIMGIIGSNGSIVQIESEGSSKLLAYMPEAGKTFLGLANILLGTTDYDEISSLAKNGKKGTMSINVCDFIPEDSPYGKFLGSGIIFAFGKVADENTDLSTYSQEDIAASLVFLLMSEVFRRCFAFASALKIKKVYIGGNIVKNLSFCFHDQIAEEIYPMKHQLEFIKSGFTGALGAILSYS